ncbi:MAG: YidC/Oxa1 family membrane protein insertase [Patescibacteria group bacterium]
MGFIITIFNEVLYRPLFNALVWLYNFIPGNDLGLAIIILTVLIRFILYPLSKKAIQSQKAISKLQPKIKEIQKKYKDKEEQAKAMMELYKKYKVNPMTGCLPILIQLPILIALYRVFFNGLNPEALNTLYSFIEKPESLNVMFLGLINLSQRSILLAVLAGAFQFVQSKMIMPQNTNKQKGESGKMDFSSMMTKQMVYMMPVITIFIAWNLPSALPLYWIVITLFGVVQQYFTKVEVAKVEIKNKS